MPFQQLPKIKSINGHKTEETKIVKDIVDPEEDQDAATKKWVSDNFT